MSAVFGGSYDGAVYPETQWGQTFYPHGTAVAGIIAAKRNNTTGIAGIAGGDTSLLSGCSLIDMKIKLNEAIAAGFYMAAVVDAARSVGTYWDYNGALNATGSEYYSHTPGFGVNVANHSYTIRTELPTLLFPDKDLPSGNTIVVQDCQMCREAFLFSLQNGVINVVARGNSSNVALAGVVNPTQIEDLFPQLLPDNWIISVGASAYDGTTLRDGINQSTSEANGEFYSLYGGNMDLIAPGSDSIVYTTRSPSLNSGNFYSSFNGTSAAAPHVTGVVALLLSHYNKDCYSQKNLSIEDVEYILEHSATDVLDTGYDELSAWGRLNAGAALKMIENVSKQIVHPDSLVSSIVITTDTIALHYNRALIGTGWGPISRPFPLEREKNYQVERLMVENTYSFAEYITPATQILDIWSRPSASNGVEFYEDTVRVIGPHPQLIDTFLVFNTFDLEPFDSIVDVDLIQKTVKTRGYYYHFIGLYNPIPNNPSPDVLSLDPFTIVNYWYPINPIIENAKLPISVYISDSTLTSYYDYPCDSLNLLYDENYSSLSVEELYDDEMVIYPNPFNTEFTLLFKQDGEKHVVICDLQGKTVSEFSTKKQLEIVSTKNFESGIYFVTCEELSNRKTFKIVKP